VTAKKTAKHLMRILFYYTLQVGCNTSTAKIKFRAKVKLHEYSITTKGKLQMLLKH